MAIIDVYALVGYISKIPPTTDYSGQLSAFAPVDNSPPVQQYGRTEDTYVSVTSNLPISEVEESIDAWRMPSFLDDYYYHIHIQPGIIEIGNLLSAQVREVEVWNAYFEPQLLSSVDQVGTEGIVLTQPQVPPTYFAALESRNYGVSVSTNGPPVIDATYTFNFENEKPTLKITGRRVVLWPFIPETGHEEFMEWKTDILNSFKNEQRLALRTAPRQAFRHTFLLDPEQFTRAKAMTTQGAHRVYGIPVWSEVSLLEGGLSAGATFIAFDTSNADYRDNDLVIIWDSDKHLIALETTTVEAGGVNLKLALEEDWPECYIAPLRFARTLSGVEYSRSSNEYVVASALFDVTQNIDLGSELDYPLYRGKPVMIDRSARVSDIKERIARTVDLFDNGSGPIQLDIKTDWVRHLQTLSFIKQSRADLWNLRRWIHARRGRQRAFWLPSWNRDLVILEDVESNASALTVQNIGYTLYYGVKNIMIQLRDGSRVFVRSIRGSVNPDGNEVLTLDAQVGVSFAAADMEFACFMSHARFDTDRVRFRHGDASRVTVSIPIAETPEE